MLVPTENDREEATWPQAATFISKAPTTLVSFDMVSFLGCMLGACTPGFPHGGDHYHSITIWLELSLPRPFIIDRSRLQ